MPPTRRRRRTLPTPLLAVALTVLVAGCLDMNPLRSSEARPAPGFTLDTIDGGNVSLEDYRGGIVVVDFMATWCQPCIKTTPALAKLQATQDVSIISISIDTTEHEAAKLPEFVAEHNASWPYAQDDGDVFKAYKGLQIPLLVFIDEEGVIRERAVYANGGDGAYEDMVKLVYRTRQGA